MDAPSVIIDLSAVARLDQKADWRHIDLLVRAWREQKDRQAVFYGVADNSLKRVMDDYGIRSLAQWKRSGRARSVSFADLDVLRLAEAHPDASIITTDLFRDHRRDFPWLQGCARVFRPVISGRDMGFEPLDYSPIPDYEVSMWAEKADLKPKGFTTPEALEALRFEWACTNAACAWGSESIIDDEPSYRDAQVRCPECGTPARRAGSRENTRELVLLIGGEEVDRIPFADGSSLVFGRGRGAGRFDVRELLDDRHAALVSRDHLRLSNREGRLLVEELGSRNGTTLVRADGGEAKLQAGVGQRLEVEDRLSIARGALQIRRSGRRRAHGRYAPDVTTAPWAVVRHDERN